MPFAGYPSAGVYKKPGKREPGAAVQQLLWGDWLKPLGIKEGKWVQVRARNQTGWMHEDDIQEERLLEVNFVDIGQGDGCLIVTPDDKFLLIDAGEGDNMYRFLRWRFGGFKQPITFECAVITHPDMDHYAGFKPILAEQNVRVNLLCHNGIVERTGSQSLGPRVKEGAVSYLTDVIRDQAALRGIIDNPARRGRMLYPNLLRLAASSGRVGDIRMLCSEDGFLPGYDEGAELSLKVLGPVPEPGPNGERRLRWFGDEGKTKNGHSVILKLQYRKVNMLLGGDLNVPSEDYLLERYTGLNPEAETTADEDHLVTAARQIFESDIAKACHHGSGDFRETYLRAVNAVATVVSSGDEESYSHPRPDALGAFGKYGRGRRPLIFSTELARSTKEYNTVPQQLRDEINKLNRELANAASESKRKDLQKQLDRTYRKLERSVAVYGMISLRTDGRKVVIAQKLEQARSAAKKWDIHQLKPGPDGRLEYLSRD